MLCGRDAAFSRAQPFPRRRRVRVRRRRAGVRARGLHTRVGRGYCCGRGRGTLPRVVRARRSLCCDGGPGAREPPRCCLPTRRARARDAFRPPPPPPPTTRPHPTRPPAGQMVPPFASPMRMARRKFLPAPRLRKRMETMTTRLKRGARGVWSRVRTRKHSASALSRDRVYFGFVLKRYLTP